MVVERNIRSPFSEWLKANGVHITTLIGKLSLCWPNRSFSHDQGSCLFMKAQFETRTEFTYVVRNNAMLCHKQHNGKKMFC